MAKKQISNYKFVPGVVVPDTNLYPNTYALLEANKKFIQEETIAYIAYNVENNIVPFIYYTYNAEKCRRDISYVLEGFISDLRKGGNWQTVNNASKYFENGIPQVDGDRSPEVAAHTFIKGLIQNFILENVAYSSLQTTVDQVIDLAITAEGAGKLKLESLSDTIIDVIEGGLDFLPEVISNRGYIKFPGYYKLKDILLITNTTRNTIIYNFADPTVAADLTYSENYDSDFPGALYGNEKITTIVLDTDTSGMMVTDALQIFVEAKEQAIRLNESARDAMERTKVGIPQSMLDADFEYGLQPTKWQAIGLMRNYPSVYEIPGSDIQVVNVVTDASTGTSNSGSSLITVTSLNAHGLTVGTPFTIKALANSVLGFSRAEGSFLVASVPSATTFTYYAKSKVGSTNGQQLSSTYTQLRKAAFYTGSAVGVPSFNVVSSGSSGTITTSLITAAGKDIIGFSGSAPPVGAPLTGAGITTGTQITAVTGTGGVAASTTLTTNAAIGATSIIVNSTAGITPGLVFNRGDGVSCAVTDVTGNTVSLGDALTSAIVGTNESYTGVTQDATTGSGSGATFTVSRSSSTYLTSVTSPGNSYAAGDTITVNGTQLGGTSPTNNATITVVSASNRDTVNSLNLASLSGGLGYTTSNNVATSTGTGGTGLTLDIIADTNGVITSAVVNSPGQNYIAGTAVSVVQTLGRALTLGATLSPGSGYTSGNNVATTGGNGTGLTVNITTESIGVVSNVGIFNGGTGYSDGISATTGLSGAVEALNNASLVAGTGYTSASNVATTGGTGTGLRVNITDDGAGGISAVSIASAGSGYTAGNTITISGGGGNATIQIQNVTAVTGTGLTVSITTIGGVVTSATVVNGGLGYVVGDRVIISGGTTNAILDINSATNGAVLTIGINNPGSNYQANDIIVISTGNSNASFRVGTVSQQATVDIGTVNTGGIIQSVSTAGTPITAPSKDFISAFTMNAVTTSEIASGNTGITYGAISTIEASFLTAHGFVPGDAITVQITSSGTNAQLAAGAFYCESVPTATTLRYTARAIGAIDNTLAGVVYSRPDSFFIHRPFDGGVQLGTGGPAHGGQAIRMSKKYIRYQSGKGVMYNTGALFAPSYDIKSISASGLTIGSVITVATDDTDHGCQIGAQITINGVQTSGYNGVYTVSDITDERTFSVIAYQALGSTTAVLDSPCYMSVRNWHGSTVRAGIFDDQNGMFWQYDGRKLAVVRRSSTFQIAGVISIAANSNLLTGTNTRFTQQLTAGDRIVIRGMTHVVTNITDDTTMTVAPDFRGVTDISSAKICKTVDLIVPQEEWNLDPCNGSGPSGYNIDICKMQMIGIQHTWYGAGFVDFMLRGPDGNYIWCHRFRNSNVNTEAYMRTGNQPVRYEVINEGAKTKLTSLVDSSTTTLPIANGFYFPNAGTILVDNELIRYTGNTGTSLTGCVRAANLTQFVAGAQRTFNGSVASSHSTGTGIVLVSNTITPIISHWGSAFMIDGQFDSDRGYIFNYAATAVTASVDKNTAFLIRLAPSVSNAQTGDLGEKELLNRAQLLLQSISVVSNSVDSSDPFVGNEWSSGGAATSGSYYNYTSSGVKNWYQATSTGTFSSTAPTFTSGTGASGTYGVNLTWAGATPNNAGGIVIEGILNPSNYPEDPTKITWTGLNSAATGGQPSFAQIASGGSVTWGGGATTSTATVQGAFTTSLTAKSFAPVTQSLTAISFSSVTRTGTATSFAFGVSSTYNSALSSGRTDFLIPTTEYDAYTTPLRVGDTVTQATYITVTRTIASLTRNYIKLNGIDYTRIVMNAAATGTSPGGAGNNSTVTFGSSIATTYNSALSSSRTDFLITQAQASSITTVATDVLSATTYITGGQTVSSITSNYATVNGTAYARVVMSSNANNTSIAGTGNNITVTSTSAATARYGSALSTARNDFLITNAAYTGSGIAVGDVLSVATYITGGQTISSITPSYITISSVAYTRIVMSAVANSTSTSGSGNDISVLNTASGTAASYTNSSVLFFTSASWTSSGATVGTRVASDQTQFPAGTSVNGVTVRTFGATTVYRVSFTQATNTTITASSTLKFAFGAQYALPGEQVFSFISNPGSTDSLSLEELKELTSTAIGGRGTFPNGPDVLAINIYKVTGASTATNLILRWGEAQA